MARPFAERFGEGVGTARGRNRGWLCIELVILCGLVLSLASCNTQKTKAAGEQAEPASGNAGQKTFNSPEAAGTALLEAANAGDQNALLAIFGPDSKEVLYSGDTVKDRNTAKNFVAEYRQMNRWDKTKSGSEILYVGADNYPFPIPLQQNATGQWYFNTAAGRDEVLARRIGDGELTAIGVLTEMNRAQQEYSSQAHDGIKQYAQKIVSDEGKQDGLYWPVASGQRPSPLGQLADFAKALGYSHSDKPQPFNGYYFRVLTKQGATAKGGAKDYMVNGKLTGGFAVLAYPAKYGDSGIMSFIVGKDGIVHEKDLGENTAAVAVAITEYNPGDGWSVVLAPEVGKAPATLRALKK